MTTVDGERERKTLEPRYETQTFCNVLSSFYSKTDIKGSLCGTIYLDPGVTKSGVHNPRSGNHGIMILKSSLVLYFIALLAAEKTVAINSKLLNDIWSVE